MKTQEPLAGLWKGSAEIGLSLLVLSGCQGGVSGPAASSTPVTPKTVSVQSPNYIVTPTQLGRDPLGPLERTRETLYLETSMGGMTLRAADPNIYARPDMLTFSCDGKTVITRASWKDNVVEAQPISAAFTTLCADREISGTEARRWVEAHPAALPTLFDGRLAENGSHIAVIDTGVSQ